MDSSGVEPSSSTKVCLICTVPIRFTRLGVHACRACAAFYKRSKISGKRLTCRQGDNQCVFRKHEKFMCRSCRFDKCTELGMEYSPVMNENEKEDSSEDVNEASPSSNEEKPLIELIRTAYENSYPKRLEHEIYVSKKHNLKRLYHPTEEFYISSMHSFMEMFPTIIKEIINIFEKAFPFLKELILEDKAAIFQDYIGKFCIIEGFYRSLLHIPTNHFLASLITCIDCDNVDQWIRDEDFVERKADFREFVRNYSDEYTALLLPLFTLEKVEEPEFMALLILGFCDIDLTLDLPEFIFEKLESIRKGVFAELQEYYKREEVSDISTRMGMLMTVAHSTSVRIIIVIIMINNIIICIVFTM
ncbi:hypothetical protein PRIPAC_80140 [Pristionchus pacificus]|uniref:Nuclear receptor n=1 Tax=Pristionchus pacificus TaxID=54126 RepID=A0A2A6C294_PRIPA|nr:hypothetical protein PRIPAC_80140 [Pristionchus pacificus]|eukprot:PDM72270.1 nuclear receptor [Pristionchus pacificus]